MSKFAPNILKTAKKGKHSEDGGLGLRITSVVADGTRKGSWFYKYTFKGQQEEIGLGSIKKLTLKDARAQRDYYAEFLSDRRNPISPREAKKMQQQEARAAKAVPTLAKATKAAFEARKAELRGGGIAGRWFSPLQGYILPKLGKKLVSEIDVKDVVAALRPIWHKKAPTADKAINRLHIVLRHARASGFDVNPLIIDDAKVVLGKQKHKVKHHPAIPMDQLQRLYQSLDVQKTVHRALAFYILAGAGMRLKPLRLAEFSEINDGIWTVPGEKMKGLIGNEEDLRIPLTEQMLELVAISMEQALEEDQLLFASPYRSGGIEKPLSDQAIENIMRGCEKNWGWEEAFRPHGIRSTFRSWASETNPATYAVAETALSHKIGNVVERSYQRHDFLEERRKLMDNWANAVTQKPERNVIAFAR